MADEAVDTRSSSPPVAGLPKHRSAKSRRKDVEFIEPAVPPRAQRGQGGGSMPDMRSSQHSPSRVTSQTPDRRLGRQHSGAHDNRKTVALPKSPRSDGGGEGSQEEGLFVLLDSYRDIGFFRVYLKREYIEELLDFYLEVDEWRELWLRFKDRPKSSSKYKKVRLAAIELYRTYLCSDAPRLINIPCGERLEIARTFAPIQGFVDTAQPSAPVAGASAGSPGVSEFAPFAAGKIATTNSSVAKPPPPLKLPKVCPELDQLELSECLFNSVQNTTFQMLLEPFTRFLDEPAFRQLQTDRLKRPLKDPHASRRQLLKAHRPVHFDDLPFDTTIQSVFCSVLAKEHSDDYLSFYLQLTAFGSSKASDLFQWASTIYESFILEERVYISTTDTQAIRSLLKTGTIDRHFYDIVRGEIEAILKTKFSENFLTISHDVNKLRRQKT